MSDATPKPKKPIYKKWWFWFLAIIVVMVIASAGGENQSGSNSGSTSQTDTAKQQEQAIPVTATKLYADYQANEIAADNTYKGKLIEVSGTVDNIGKDILDSPYVSLKTSDLFGVQCMLDDSAIAEASALAKGTKVTLRGRVSGKLGSVLVRECVLVK